MTDMGASALDASGGSRVLGGNRAVVVSATSTVAFFAVLLGVIFFAPQTQAFRDTFLDLHSMKESFFGVPGEGIPAIWRGFLTNIEIFLIAEVLILVLALLIAVVRQIPGPVFFPFRLVATAYTDFFRGTPLLLVLFMLGYGVRAMDLKGVSDFPVVVYGTIALVLSYSAYVAEVYRAGIESIHSSQLAAARSLGLSQWKALRFVILPQAIRRVIPPLLNDFVSLQKDTALLMTLGVIEAGRAANIYASLRFNYSPYVMAAVLFILMTIPLARFTDHLIERDRRRRQAGE